MLTRPMSPTAIRWDPATSRHLVEFTLGSAPMQASVPAGPGESRVICLSQGMSRTSDATRFEPLLRRWIAEGLAA